MSVAKKQLNNYFEANPKLAIHYLISVVFNDSDNYHFQSIATNFEGMLNRSIETYILQNDPDNIAYMGCLECDTILKQMVYLCKTHDPEMLNRSIYSWDVSGYLYLEEIQKSFITSDEELEWWEKDKAEALKERAFNRLPIEEQERILNEERYKREEVW